MAFAYTIIVLNIWKGNSSTLKYIWYASIPVLVFGFELLQLSGGIHGTFCLNDILSGAIGIIIGCIILFKGTRHTTSKISIL